MIKKIITLAIAIVGLFMAVSCATTSPGARTVTAPAPSPAASPVAQTNPNATVGAIDQAFVQEASQAASANIRLGQLALNQSNNADVRRFAQAEIDEQTQNQNDLARLTPSLGITPPNTTLPKYQAAYDRLSQLTGRQFDSAYMSEGGINAHLENAALFQREAAFGQNPDLVAITDRGLPIINNHFTTASQLTNYRFAQVPQRFNNIPQASNDTTPQ